MRRVWPWALVLLAGCHSPDDVMWLRGVVEQAPRRVELLRSVDPLDGCLSLAPWRAQDSDADGGYAFQVVRAEVEQLTNGWPLCLEVLARFPSGTEHRIDWSTGVQASLELPPLRDWAPGFVFEAHTDHVHFTRPEGCVANEVTFDHLVVSQPGALVWTATATSSPLDGGAPEGLAVPPEVLEDFAGLTLSIETARWGCSQGVEGVPPREQSAPVPERWRAGEVATTSGRTPPASRSASCDTGTPCPLTDGVLTPVVLPGGTRVLRFDVAQPVRVRTVVLRGLVSAASRVLVRWGSETVEHPLSQEVWPPTFNLVPSPSAPRYLLVDVGASSADTHVELEFDQPVEQLAEVSFFE